MVVLLHTHQPGRRGGGGGKGEETEMMTSQTMTSRKQ